MKSKNCIVLYLYNALINLRFTRALGMLYALHLGLSVFEFGFVQSIYAIAKFIFEVPSGMIADKIKRKNILFIASFFYFFVNISLFGLAFSTTQYKVVIISVLYMLDAVSFTLISGTDQSLLFEILEKNNLSNTFEYHLSRIQIIALVFLSISTIIGGTIAKLGLKTVFFVQAMVYLLSGINILYVKEEKINKTLKTDNRLCLIDDLRYLWGLLKNEYNIVLIMILFGVIEANVNILTIFSQGYFSDLRMDVSVITLLIGGTTLFGIIGAFFAPYLSNLSMRTFILSSILVFTISVICFVNSNIIIVILGFALISILFDLISPRIFNCINEKVINEKRATVLSISNLVSNTLFLILNLVYADMVRKFGYSRAFLYGGGISAFILIIIYFKINKKN